MSKYIFAALLTLGSMLSTTSVSAQSGTREQIRMIEQEYSRQSNGRMISDDQLEYYLDRSNSGWTMRQISEDMANSRRQYQNNPWRPQSGWAAREVICSSIGSQYQACAVPFRGRAIITQQISQSACIEGQSWGQKPGQVWVNRGCRARFGIVAVGNGGNPGNGPMIVCQSNNRRYRECNTGFRGRVELVNRLNNSAACVEGRTWGQRQGTVWVSRGCRARFTSVGRPGRRDDGNWDNNAGNGGWSRDDNYAVTCSSDNGGRVRCNWDTRYDSPRMVQQLSASACVEGRDWGYDSQGGLWVDSGCRARFGAR